MAMDGNDNVHVVWYDHRYDQAEIFYEKVRGGMDTDRRLTNLAGDQWAPAIGVDNDQHIQVLWHGNSPGNCEIFRLQYNGAARSALEQVTDDPATSANVSLAIGPDNHLHIAFKDNRSGNFDIYYKTFDGIAWSEDAPLTTDPTDAGCPSIACDPDGNIHVVWQDSRHGDPELYHRSWDGRDSSGHRVAPGIYVLRLEAGDLRRSAKVVVLR
jgi:hypothetical protein